ncbi:hypothetical protein EGJ23_01635 [Pseudomonas sp. o96-267]|uniref:hypothetical protein n=1 Tax=Pseudomonas sp. o96-267 TaxID=2479853 RepID=UPI000F788880|nr:hypothetical protein [Pseudomonas sp. o96-267]RRV29665.1 hypothetical protein EGJ23_01635 [Pseudomonas sp. o96-267]
MATPTIYKSSDASAPAITSVGVLGVLQACLVDGYGAKAPAGWTLAYSGTGKAVYKNSHGDCALRVAAVSTSAELTAADDFTDVDTPVGALWGGATSLYCNAFAASGNRPWILFATDELVLLFANSGVSLTHFSAQHTQWLFFGRAISRDDNPVANVLSAFTSNSAGNGMHTNNFIATTNQALNAIYGFCQKDSSGGTSGHRQLGARNSVPNIWDNAGAPNGATWIGQGGYPVSIAGTVTLEPMRFIRANGHVCADVPMYLPHNRFEFGAGQDLNETIEVAGEVMQVIQAYGSGSLNYAVVMVPHDNW